MGKNRDRKGFINFAADTLNNVDGSTVWVYDKTVEGAGKVWAALKKAKTLKSVSKGMIAKGLRATKNSEIVKLEKKISNYEKQINRLYFEIGKKGARHSQEDMPLESETVKELITDVKEYEKEIDRLKNRIIDTRQEKVKRKWRKKELKKDADFVKLKEKATQDLATIKQIDKIVEYSISAETKNGVFDSRTERENFFKVVSDLLDNEIEIKCLAAAELGEIRNKAAVPILMDAINYDDSELVLEIINALISIGDKRAIPLFSKKTKSTKHKIRIGCLRGLFKLADNDIDLPILTKALSDDHPEVRRTALTFIGWKDYEETIPSVIQCLVDEEARVRKAAVSTLANFKDESSVISLIDVLGDKDLEIREATLEAIKAITGEVIEFDINAGGEQLLQNVLYLKQCWQEMRADEEVDELEGTGFHLANVEDLTDENTANENVEENVAEAMEKISGEE